jgi:hypothetical protein
MPDKITLERAHRDAQQGKSASTQAGEFVREQIHHIREGKYGAHSTQQAIAIGLSEARRAGVPLQPSGSAPRKIQKKAKQDLAAGRSGKSRLARGPSPVSGRSKRRGRPPRRQRRSPGRLELPRAAEARSQDRPRRGEPRVQGDRRPPEWGPLRVNPKATQTKTKGYHESSTHT